MWDNSGAPAWATITDGLPSETYSGQRELNSRCSRRRAIPLVQPRRHPVGVHRHGRDAGEPIQGRQHGRRLQPVQRADARLESAARLRGSPPLPFYRRVIDAVTGTHDGLPCLYADLHAGRLWVSRCRSTTFGSCSSSTPAAARGDRLSHPPRPAGELVSEPGAGHPSHTHAYTIDALVLHQSPDKATYRGAAMTRPTASPNERQRPSRRLRDRVRERSDLGPAHPRQSSFAEQEQHLVGSASGPGRKLRAVIGNSRGIADPVDCKRDPRVPQACLGLLADTRSAMVERVYPAASADSDLTYRYDPSTGAFSSERRPSGEPPTVVSHPADRDGPGVGLGAVVGQAAVSQSPDARTVTVYPPAAGSRSRSPRRSTSCRRLHPRRDRKASTASAVPRKGRGRVVGHAHIGHDVDGAGSRENHQGAGTALRIVEVVGRW